MEIHAIAFDLDGTALTSDKRLTDATKEALSRACGAGIALIPATGRKIKVLPEGLAGACDIPYVISDNGTMITDMRTGSIIYSRSFEPMQSRAIIGAARRYPAMVYGSSGERDFIDARDFSFDAGLENLCRFWQGTGTGISDLLELMDRDGVVFNEFVLVFSGREAREECRAEAGRIDGCSVASSEWYNLELMPSGASKGAALRHLLGLMKIDPRHTVCIGDNYNDKELMQTGGLRVAMGNAVGEIRAGADHVAPDNDSDGVADVIGKVLSGFFDGWDADSRVFTGWP